MNTPSQFQPIHPSDFIGGAARIAKILRKKADDAKTGKVSGPIKVLLFGPPGTGKTRLAEMMARLLVAHSVYTESVNGRLVNLECVHQWMRDAAWIPVGWTVKLVNEIDTATPAAQDLLLTYLDLMKHGHAFIGTSNLDLTQLTERFQSRLQQFKVLAPDSGELANWLRKKWHIAEDMAHRIAVGCGGNVRAALLDSQTALEA